MRQLFQTPLSNDGLSLSIASKIFSEKITPITARLDDVSFGF
jgi:hypothetical protein